MKFRLLLLVSLITAFCYSQKAKKWTFDQGYQTGKHYCKGGKEGLELGRQHTIYWNQKGQTEYANGIKAQLQVCHSNGDFKSPGKGSSKACDILRRIKFPSSIIGCNRSDDSGNSEQ